MPDRTKTDIHRIVFLGPPGSGKGTQARLLSANHGLTHISTGVILRREINAGTPLGLEAKKYIENGGLTPDELVRALAEKAMTEINCRDFVLDGYPRTLRQAHWLQDFLDSRGISLTAALNLVIDDEDVVLRLSQRRIHRRTGENFHLSHKPPPEEELEYIISRPDDHPDAIRKRLKVYDQHTRPLVEYYRSQDLLLTVHALGSFREVRSQVCKLLQLSF